MRRTAAILLISLSLGGCAPARLSEFDREKGVKPRGFTPLPYEKDDNLFEAAGKTFVNVPVWTLEGALLAALAAAYVCGASGYTPSIR